MGLTGFCFGISPPGFRNSGHPKAVCHYSSALVEKGAGLVSASPRDALLEGRWVKLICGASMDDVPFVETLSELYTLAGVDCIDCAADPAVVGAVLAGIESANGVRAAHKLAPTRPFVMVSVNDGEDPHFRKAVFDPLKCPSDCPRPCERVCPTNAISTMGVSERLCYGCGRCLRTCPLGLIIADTYVRSPEDMIELLRNYPIDAIEIHTLPSHMDEFTALWSSIGSWVLEELKLVAVSFPDSDHLEEEIQVRSEVLNVGDQADVVWQTDGQPMSGDVGRGMAAKSVRLAKKVLQLGESLSIPGFVQLAGGTNDATVELMQKNAIYGKAAGVAFGGFARKVTLNALQISPDHALESAIGLLEPIKAPLNGD
ncbi:hypothetical protein NDN08_004436 [Rhodosorus marinus]|uniref:4Fe-4S ferredoxin-type domain-containing protein n=1 Tax=Rhodosorus marinus TaxID=101924 RepID=A0AAV8UP13_9RHOD|nr:hypothetical protein NDN08_004436 [Rhodosorus marinus]